MWEKLEKASRSGSERLDQKQVNGANDQHHNSPSDKVQGQSERCPAVGSDQKFRNCWKLSERCTTECSGHRQSVLGQTELLRTAALDRARWSLTASVRKIRIVIYVSLSHPMTAHIYILAVARTKIKSYHSISFSISAAARWRRVFA